MLDDALVAAELAKAEEAAARNGSRLEREAARVLRERAQLAEKSARLESKALQSQWHQARLARAARLAQPRRRCSALDSRAALGSCHLADARLRTTAQKANNLTGENMEATYSLVSSAVELLELRQQLAAAELRQGASPRRSTVLPRAEVTRASRRRERRGRPDGDAHQLRDSDEPASCRAGVQLPGCKSANNCAEAMRARCPQEAKRHAETEVMHLRAQLTSASQVLSASAAEIEEMKVRALVSAAKCCTRRPQT